MKPYEILSALPGWATATADAIVASPALSVPCRIGETPCAIKTDAEMPADTLDLEVKFGDETHVLGLADSAAFTELHAVWPMRAEVPAPILLALAERECGAVFQVLENAVRRQLAVVGIASSAEGPFLAMRIVTSSGKDMAAFRLTRSASVCGALGQLRNIDATHPDVRERPYAAEAEYATFALSAEEVSALAPGDSLLLPELDAGGGAWPVRAIVGGKLKAAAATGVTPWTDDGLFRVLGEEPVEVGFGELADIAADPSAWESAPALSALSAPKDVLRLKLVRGDRVLARGRLETLTGHCAMAVETVE